MPTPPENMKLFILLPRVPFPLEKGDKLRAFHQIRHLSKHCEIHLCCLNEGKVAKGAAEALKPYVKSIHILKLSRIGIYWNTLKAFFRGQPLQIGYFYSCRCKAQVRKLIEEIKPDHVYAQLIRVAEYVSDLPVPKTLDYQDVFSTGYARQADHAKGLRRRVFRREARLLKRYEREVFKNFDHHTIISLPDREAIDHPEKGSIHIIHNGVDTEYFSKRNSLPDTDILFTGNMNYPPNILGAEYLVNEILPVVRKTRPAVSVMIAGAHPSEKVKRLASDQVTVTGWIPDIRDAYAGARVFIAPMSIGTGLQNKLLEAMAMGLPCITSPLVNAALGAAPGREILIGENPEDYAEAVLKLLNQPAEAENIAAAGLEFVRTHYSWEKETARLLDIIRSPR